MLRYLYEHTWVIPGDLAWPLPQVLAEWCRGLAPTLQSCSWVCSALSRWSPCPCPVPPAVAHSFCLQAKVSPGRCCGCGCVYASYPRSLAPVRFELSSGTDVHLFPTFLSGRGDSHLFVETETLDAYSFSTSGRKNNATLIWLLKAWSLPHPLACCGG